MKKHPPKSFRYCMCCKNETIFKYDRQIGHSRCIECGWHYIPTFDTDNQYGKEKAIFEALKLKKIPTEKENQKSKQIQILKELKKFKYKG